MAEQEPLIPTFIPALIALLVRAEDQKGSLLTEDEVRSIRNNGACVMLPQSEAIKMSESRGYDDIDPECVWEHWQIARVQLRQSE